MASVWWLRATSANASPSSFAEGVRRPSPPPSRSRLSEAEEFARRLLDHGNGDGSVGEDVDGHRVVEIPAEMCVSSESEQKSTSSSRNNEHLPGRRGVGGF